MEYSKVNFWLDQLQNRSNAVVINGSHYRIGSTPYPAKGYGFGGDEFRIKLNTGEEIRTKDLWHQGEIPETMLHLFPNTGRWIRTIEVKQFKECPSCHTQQNRDTCYKTTCYNVKTINEQKVEVR